MAKRAYKRDDVERLLKALDDQIRAASRLAGEAQREASRHSFEPYRTFREKVSESQTLMILIENRLGNLEDGASSNLAEAYERLEGTMMALLIRASLRFFFLLSANPILPLGAREIFMEELQTLHGAAKRLREPRFEGKLSTDIQNDLETASEILEEIIDKAPSLLKFDR